MKRYEVTYFKKDAPTTEIFTASGMTTDGVGNLLIVGEQNTLIAIFHHEEWKIARELETRLV